jgi:hypothetical protein
MIEPTVKDIGRAVRYTRVHNPSEPDEGIITSLSNHYVFVRYGSDVHSKATRRDDLEWA